MTHEGRVYLDARLFSEMRLPYSNLLCNGARGLTALGGCTKRWNHRSGRGVTGDDSEGPLDIPYVICSEELLYVAEAVRLFRQLRCEPFISPILDLSHCALTYPYIIPVDVKSRLFWGPEFDLEQRLGTIYRTGGVTVFPSGTIRRSWRSLIPVDGFFLVSVPSW